jgi:hypothetical protein
MIIYLDESGDLGWKFDKPYGSGGSSRYITITFVLVPITKKDLLRRTVHKTYDKFHFDTKQEYKGCDLKPKERDYFIDQAINLLNKHPDIKLGAITTKKERVYEHIRSDGNKLYNFMINLGFIDDITPHQGNITLLRDERSIKVNSGNNLIDYLQTKLWFEKGSKARLIDEPTKSDANDNLLFIDWISNMIWNKYEFGIDEYFNKLVSNLDNKKFLF